MIYNYKKINNLYRYSLFEFDNINSFVNSSTITVDCTYTEFTYVNIIWTLIKRVIYRVHLDLLFATANYSQIVTRG